LIYNWAVKNSDVIPAQNAIPIIDMDGANAFEASRMQEIWQRFDKSGAVLLRDFNLSLDSFEHFSGMFCDNFHEVGTRVSLRKQSGDGYSSEVHRENFTLLGHSEGTYRPWPPPPDICFFYCVVPPTVRGGETTLMDGVSFCERLPDKLRTRFIESGVIYQSHWEPARWRAEFQLENLTELESLLSRFPSIDFSIKDEFLDIRYTAKAISLTRRNDLAFANALLAHLPRVTHRNYQHNRVYCKDSNQVFFGDGERIGDEVINVLIDIQDELLLAHQWQARDLLLLDNTWFMHGRRMTEAPCERVLFSRFGILRKDLASALA